MKQWEQRALLREQEDPRRRASVTGRLVEGLATLLPVILAVVGGLLLVTGVWHLGGVRESTGRLVLALVSLGGGIGCGVAAVRTRVGTVEPARAHDVLLITTLLVAGVAFSHLVITRDPAHSATFAIILIAAGAFYQNGAHLAVAGLVVIVLWTIGLGLVDPLPGGLAPAGMAMLSALILTTVISVNRLRALRRLQSLNLELKDQIGFDPLTGIANRRAFGERLEALWEQLQAEPEPLALVMMDLDDFKNLNDTRGHGEGDGALRQIGGVLRMAVRSTEDLPARLGGEEFAVLLPRTGEAHAAMIAERIREGVQYTDIPNPGAWGDGILTGSLGVALMWPRDGGVPSDLLDRADQALYRAKHGGRNRVVMWEPEHGAAVRAPYQADFDRPLPTGPVHDEELPPETDDPFQLGRKRPSRAPAPDLG